MLGRVENIVEKEKMLITSIFSFAQNVFKSFLFHRRKKSGLSGKVLSWVKRCEEEECLYVTDNRKNNLIYPNLRIAPELARF